MAGGYIALPIWMSYMKLIFPWDNKARNRKFPKIPAVSWTKIDELTGLKSTTGRSMPMLPGTGPKNIAVTEGQKTTEDLLNEDF